MPVDSETTGIGARRSGTCETIAEKAPDGVGKSVTSPFLALRGRRARNAQKHIQAKSTPRSVQEKIICVNVAVADGFMGTSFFAWFKEIFSDKRYLREIAGRARSYVSLLLLYLTDKDDFQCFEQPRLVPLYRGLEDVGAAHSCLQGERQVPFTRARLALLRRAGSWPAGMDVTHLLSCALRADLSE